MKNEMTIEFDAISENESFARVAVAAFLASLDPSLEEMEDVKTAVSEAVTNVIIHAYPDAEQVETMYVWNQERNRVEREFPRISEKEKKVTIRANVEENMFTISVIDQGIGILNVKKAMEPLFTTKADEERSGMGFSFMEAFMDRLVVESQMGIGTTVHMMKKIGKEVPVKSVVSV